MNYKKPYIKIINFDIEDVIVVSGQCTEADQGCNSCDGPLLSGANEGNAYDGTPDIGSGNGN